MTLREVVHYAVCFGLGYFLAAADKEAGFVKAVMLGFLIVVILSPFAHSSELYLPGPPGIVVVPPDMTPEMVQLHYPRWRMIRLGARVTFRKGSLQQVVVPFQPTPAQSHWLFATFGQAVASSGAWRFETIDERGPR